MELPIVYIQTILSNSSLLVYNVCRDRKYLVLLYAFSIVRIIRCLNDTTNHYDYFANNIFFKKTLSVRLIRLFSTKAVDYEIYEIDEIFIFYFLLKTVFLVVSIS